MTKYQFTFLIWLVMILIAAQLSGCAYYNTFYDVKKKFNEAEREYNGHPATPQQQQNQSGQPSQPGSPPRQPQQQQNVPTDKYRKVIETASKLLEFYPKSRWVDDALLLMGISYFRLGDFARADRKFTELMTIFPNSNHVGEATIWKARTLLEQKKKDEAIDLLSKKAPELKQRKQRGQVELLLAETEYDAKNWDDASTHFKLAEDLLGAGEERWEARYSYGVCQYEQKQFEEAEKAFTQVMHGSRDRRRAYDAYLYTARTAVALGDPARAQKILLRLKNESTYEDLSGDVDLELADLAVKTGRVDEGIDIYNKYAAEQQDRARRGLAFYRLAQVYRKQRVDLDVAKSMLDSVVRVGADPDIVDSARANQNELARGIMVLSQMRTLKDSLNKLEVERIVLMQKKAGVFHPAVMQIVNADSTTRQDSTVRISAPTDTVSQQSDSTHTGIRQGDSVRTPGESARAASLPATPPALVDSSIHKSDSLHSTVPPVDSMAIARDTLKAPVTRKVSPATLAADSILKALQKTLPPPDTLTKAPAHHDSLQAPVHAAHADSAVNPDVALDQLNKNYLKVQREYQLAVLRVAEFYELDLAEHDSALVYYKLAAVSPLNPKVYWKANLYLGHEAAGDSARAADATQYFQNVVKADSVPIDAANEARQVLGMPPLEAAPSPQMEAFKEAEQLSMTDSVPADSVLRMYSRVVAYDSASVPALRAMFAQLYLYEHRLHQPDSAIAIAHCLIALHPDSSYADQLKPRVLPPDSGSIFLLSDEELNKKNVPADSLTLETPTEGGWPPAEETLKGRRYD